MIARAALLVATASIFALPAEATTFLLRTKGAQIDEAVGAFKGGYDDAIVEMAVDEATSLDVIAARVVESGATAIVAVGARAAQLALRVPRVPVVHCMVLQDAASFDTERSVGVPLAIPVRQQLQTLRRLAPRATKVGVLFDPKLNGRTVDEASAAARALGMTLVSRPVATATEAPAALDKLLPSVDALLVLPDATVVSKELMTFLIGRAFDKQLPVLAYSEGVVKLGALAALAPQYAQNGKLCAKLAARVAAGEAPASLKNAVEMTGTLVVNAATARKIGLTLSADVLKAPTLVVGQ